MNKVLLIGRVVRDPDIRANKDTGMKTARISLAIDRGKDKDGKDLGADFPTVICFGKTADVVEKYCEKGRQIGVSGKISTGSYTDKEGRKVYMTDVIADSIELLGSRPTQVGPGTSGFETIPDDVEDEGLPFN